MSPPDASLPNLFAASNGHGASPIPKPGLISTQQKLKVLESRIESGVAESSMKGIDDVNMFHNRSYRATYCRTHVKALPKTNNFSQKLDVVKKHEHGSTKSHFL